jgi:hypothetical protein
VNRQERRKLVQLLRKLEREDLGERYPRFHMGEWSRAQLEAMTKDLEERDV